MPVYACMYTMLVCVHAYMYTYVCIRWRKILGNIIRDTIYLF